MKYGRKDYARKLEEAGRISKSTQKSRKNNEKEEDGMEQLSMRKSSRASIRYLDQGDKPAPLHRYLASQVGKSWNIVYSELVKNVPPRKRHHLDQHVGGYVDIYGEVRLSWYHRAFFVDDNGILQTNGPRPRWRRKYTSPDKNLVKKDGRIFFRHISNTWFELFKRENPRVREHSRIYRAARGDLFEIVREDEFYKSPKQSNKYDWSESYYGTWRQLSKKEVVELKLESESDSN